MTYKEKLAAAFVFARNKAPYFDAALTGLVRVEVQGLAESTGIVGALPTMGVTKTGVLLYEREALERWDVEETAAVLAHEIGHILRSHADRCSGFGGHPILFNIAGDAELNDDLLEGQWKLSSGAILPAGIDAKNGLTAEEYYPYVESITEFVCCGSGAGNPFPGEPDEVTEPGRTPGELAHMRHEVAEGIQREQAKGRGNISAGWGVWSKQYLTPPKVRWQDELARATRRAIASRPGGVTHTWRRLSRRQAACGYGPGRPIMPALSQPEPRVAVVVDTSGSMGQSDLTIALREVNGVLRAVGGTVEFVAIDCAVHASVSVRSIDQLAALLKGGGGTDFRPAFEVLRKKAPEVVIFATDGDGPAPAEPPAWCNTIWLLIGEHARPPCSWGKHIQVKA